MSRAPLPECRGSHLAGARERQKAIKLYRRQSKPRRDERWDEMPKAEQNVVPMKKKQTRQTQRRCLPQEVVTRLLSQRNSRGIVACLTAMRSHDPHATDGGLRARWNVLVRYGATHSWTQGHLNLWLQLDREFCGVREQKKPVATPVPTKMPTLDVKKPVAAASPMTQMLAIMQQQHVAMMELMKSFVEQESQPPALPPAQHNTLPQPKDFPDMAVGMQRSIIVSMIDRAADMLKQHIPDVRRAYAKAWSTCYEAFDREYGLRVVDRANEQSDSTGHRCHPLDIIESDGNLARFYEIIRRTWFETE